MVGQSHFRRRLIGLTVLLCLTSGCRSVDQDATSSVAQGWFSGPSLAGREAVGRKAGPIYPKVQDSNPREGTADWSRETVDSNDGSTPVGEPNDGARTITLDFTDVELQTFVRTVFNEVLHENVAIDPSITGRITLRTPEPIPRTAVLEYIRSILEMNGASLTQEAGLYRVTAAGSSQASGVRNNYAIVSLKNASAKDVASSLKAVSPEAQISTGPGESSIVIGGAGQSVDALTSLARSLDKDEMAGRSFVLHPLRQANAGTVANEMSAMFGKAISVIPLTRMNAIIVSGRSRQSVERALRWALRLDTGVDDGQQVYVYPVQNRRAVDLEKLLVGLLETGNPGSEQVIAPAFEQSMQSGEEVETSRFDVPGNSGPPQNTTFEQMLQVSSGPARSSSDTDTSVRADIGTNSLVITSSPEAWPEIEATIRRLDVLPRQVLVEVLIVEVTLNNALKHGVRWFLESGNHGLNLNDTSSRLPQTGAGFNYLFDVPSARVVINALERATKVQVVSSPALTVLDNQTAKLQVGDEVPIATRSARDLSDSSAPIVNEIEMRQTGVILSVTPRVNASGLVMLDVTQEASDVVATTTSTLDSPTIRNRSVNSTVSVSSGTEIILGGLISKRRERGKSGIPIFQHIPIIGEAFTSDSQDVGERTELMIIIRPTVMNDMNDVRMLTDEIRTRLGGTRD